MDFLRLTVEEGGDKIMKEFNLGNNLQENSN